MPDATQPTLTDPIAVFLQRALAFRPPEPAMESRYDVLIEAGLAVVTTSRRFKN